jgi:hypothetical protein
LPPPVFLLHQLLEMGDHFLSIIGPATRVVMSRVLEANRVSKTPVLMCGAWIFKGTTTPRGVG